MIFDGDDVTKLVLEWQDTHDHNTMDTILSKSQHLIEAIVSKHDSVYREDLIQESMLRLQYACEFYDPRISSLHNFFTTVIHNISSTYVIKQEREYLLDDTSTDDDDDLVEIVDTQAHTERIELSSDMLTELICYLRKRFPSIPASILDDCAETVYYGLRNTESYRNIITDLNKLTLSRSISVILYNVVVVYLRWQNISCAVIDLDDIPELSLLHELRLITGDDVYSKIIVAFAGMAIRFPQ